MAGIDKNLMYIVTDRCVARREENGGMVRAIGRDIDVDLSMKIDERAHLISYNSVCDFKEYIMYFNLISTISATILGKEGFVKGNFVAMLDNGFVPFHMPPTYMSDVMYEKMINMIKRTNITWIEEKTMRLNGSIIEAEKPDIWISRVEAAEYSGQSLRDFKILEFAKGVWLYGYDN